MPITDFLSYMRMFDEFESLSPRIGVTDAEREFSGSPYSFDFATPQRKPSISDNLEPTTSIKYN